MKLPPEYRRPPKEEVDRAIADLVRHLVRTAGPLDDLILLVRHYELIGSG